MKATVKYPGKYLKRPPLEETSIKHDDGTIVACEYLDHDTNVKEAMTLPTLTLLNDSSAISQTKTSEISVIMGRNLLWVNVIF